MLDSQNSLFFTVLSFAIAGCVLFFLLYTVIKYLNNNNIWPEFIVLAGAFSNLIDRCLYKGVVDFILLTCPYGSWPVFNCADVFIVCGLVWMICKGMYE